MLRSRGRLSSVARWVALMGVVLGGWFGCSRQQDEVTGPEAGAPASLAVLEDAAASVAGIQEQETDRLMAIPGVVGTAVGLTRDGRPAIKVYTRSSGVKGIPSALENVPVVVEVTGEFHSMELRLSSAGGPDPLSNTTKRWPRPVPIGVSTGNEGECSAGTISARLRGPGGSVLALSNNHVFALQNTAPIGSDVLQPGRFDTVPQCSVHAADHLGTLADFEPLVFSTSAKNKIDAAVAEVTTGDLKNKTPSDGYGLPRSAIVSASVGLDVQKFGRTTKLTHGAISGINAVVNVGYPSGTARFVKQIVVSSPDAFILPGDSGSLLVTDPNRNPVGLLYAGTSNGKTAIANRIDLVLNRFGATIDGQ